MTSTSVQEKPTELKKQPSCAFNQDGVTLFGIHVSWLFLIIVGAIIFFVLHKQGMLGDEVSSVLNPPAKMTTGSTSGMVGVSANVAPMAGPVGVSGEVGRFFNHNY
jgi:hypothetical protein